MAALLASAGVSVDRLFSSSAVRAVETARLLAPGLGLAAEAVEILPDLYTFDPHQALALLRSLDTGEAVVGLVGHNPAMHELVEWLSGETVDAFPTAAVALLELPENEEPDRAAAELIRLWTPKGALAHYQGRD